MQQVVVIIPIYKETLRADESFSLKIALKRLHKYTFVFVAPENLDVSAYDKVCETFEVDKVYKKFPEHYFYSVSSYNSLLLQPIFYESFLDYNYMLIYQLDALVFTDALESWCDKGYDYIGAPWFKEFKEKEPELQSKCGNGGLSLRNVNSTHKMLKQASKTSFAILKRKEYIEQKRYFKAFLTILKSKKSMLSVILDIGMQEDIALSHYLPRFYMDYRVANSDVAMHFSFEEYPEKLYELTERKLPFGCHAFLKHNFLFWKKHLNIVAFDEEEL